MASGCADAPAVGCVVMTIVVPSPLPQPASARHATNRALAFRDMRAILPDQAVSVSEPAEWICHTQQALLELRDRDSNPKFLLQRQACCQLHHPGSRARA